MNVIADGLNVRSGPATKFRILGQLHRGDRVKVEESDGAWRWVTPGGGWVHSAYLAEDAPEPLRPPRLRPARICIDPGHGGRDPGARAPGGVTEADVSLQAGLSLSRELRARGHAVLLTRTGPADLAPAEPDWRKGKGEDLKMRWVAANGWGADLFVSLHCNASSSAESNGAWVLYADPSDKGRALAHAVFARLAEIPQLVDADPEEEVVPDVIPWTNYRSGVAVLRHTAMPAILVEMGFLSNVADRLDLTSASTIDVVSRAIATGLEDYLGMAQIGTGA